MSLTSGTRLGPYEILTLLGAGGMGEVYRAHDPRLGRDVAVKVLPFGLAGDRERRVRLMREGRAAASLNHPNICTIHDVGEAGGHVYIAMELIDGQPLSTTLAGGPLTSDQVMRYGTQLADALAHAHDRGLVHRDFKSANVIIATDGRVKILDFGLAKQLIEAAPDAMTTDVEAERTRTGTILGTVPYMAPEQLRGEPADCRSDVWALGVVLYEMATGGRPFAGKTDFDLSSAIFHDPPSPLPSTLAAPLPAVIGQCLEKEPARRYQRAGEVRAALEAGMAGAVSSTPVPSRSVVVAAHSRRRGLVTLAAVVLMALGVVAAFWSRHGSGVGAPAGGSPTTIQSIAVLPLENLSRDPEQDYFAAGMHDALITDLTRIGLQKVIAKASADVFKGSNKPPAEIGRELGVEGLLTGSVIRAGDRVQVNVQLVRAESGAIVWANRYERSVSDVLSLQNELVSAIAGEIRTTIAPRQRARLSEARQIDPAAHDAYLRARSSFASFTNSADTKYLDASITQFERAIQLDPTYAPAYAGLSWSYQTASQGSWRPPREAFPQARAAALKAVELDDELATAHAALAGAFFWFDWNWSGAAHEIERALQLNPDSVEALTASEVYATLVSGHLDDAARTSQRIIEVDPLNPFSRLQPVWVSYFSRRYDDSITKAKTLAELSPNNLMAPWFLASNYGAKRMGPDVARECTRVMELLGGAFVMQPIAMCAANLGLTNQKVEAGRLLQRLGHPPAGIWLDPAPMGDAYAGMGDEARAVEWYERGLEERSPNMVYMKADPVADSVRGNARFQALMRNLNLPN